MITENQLDLLASIANAIRNQKQPTLRERLITAAMGTPIPGWFEPRSREITRLSQWPIAYADMVLAELADEEDAPMPQQVAFIKGKPGERVSDEAIDAILLKKDFNRGQIEPEYFADSGMEVSDEE